MRKKAWFVAIVMCLPLTGVAGTINADSGKAIQAALKRAKAGDTIVVKPGEYQMNRVNVGKSGTEAKPITFRCKGDKGYARLKTTGSKCAYITGKHWVFIGIHFDGNPSKSDSVVFLQTTADNLTFKDCKISGSGLFGVKSGRTREVAVDNVTFEHCELFNTKSTGFDLVTGDNWVMRNNYVHDYGLAGGGSSRYGLFLKGGGKNGIVEGNIIDGKNRKGVLIGISIGGGLTGAKWLPLGKDGKVAPEHDGAIVRNNIVMNVSDDAYHNNKSANSRFYNNLSWNCGTFRRRGEEQKLPVLQNNLIRGRLRGAGPGSKNNVTSVQAGWFVKPGDSDFRLTKTGEEALTEGAKIKAEENPTDFFGSKRDQGKPVMGPVLPGAKQSTKWVDRRK